MQSAHLESPPPRINEILGVVRSVARHQVRRWKAGRIGPLDEDDVVHEVLLKMMAAEGGLLAQWDPLRGSLKAYVRMVASCRVTELERREFRRMELLGPVESLNASPGVPCAEQDPESQAIARDELAHVVQCARGRIHEPLQLKVFESILLQEPSIDSLCRQVGASKVRVYRARAAVRQKLHACPACLASARGAMQAVPHESAGLRGCMQASNDT